MKAALIFVLVAVIGAQARRVTRDAPTDVFALQIFMEESKITELSNRCKNVSGSDEAFKNIEPAFNNLFKCVDNVIDIQKTQDKLKEDLASPDTPKEETIQDFFKEICPLANSILHCGDEAIISGVRPCLHKNEYEAVDEMVRSVHAVIDYVCFNDGERVVQLINDGVEECFTEHQEELTKCTSHAAQKPDEPFSFDYSKKDCDEVVELESCIVAGLSKCEKQTIAGIIKGLFDTIIKETKCPTFATGNEI